MGPTQRRPSWAHGILASLIVALGLLGLGLLAPSVGLSREIELTGTVDCGLASGRRCSVGDELAIWTDGLSGRRERAVIDVAWVRRQLPRLDQDDLVCLQVEDGLDGRLRAVGLTEPCGVEGTVNPGASTGSRLVPEGGLRRDDEDDDEDRKVAAVATATPAAPAATPRPGALGTLVGTIRHAATARAIAGAVVRGPNGSATTDANGRFTLTGVPTGSQTLETSATGFVTETRRVVVTSGSNPELSIGLVPLATTREISIVLTWGERPEDLDAHLSGPAPGGGRFHLFYAAPNPVPYASLVRDDRAQFGPELVIVIQADPSTGQFAPGEYRYWAHNFSQTPEFDVSRAHVTVTQGDRQVAGFDVSDARSDPSQDLWHVVNLTIDSAGNVTAATVQQFRPGTDETAL